MQQTTRREFVNNVTAAGFLTTNLFTDNIKGANNKIRVGVIGPGKQGQGLMMRCHGHPETEVVALCDPCKAMLEMAKNRLKKAGQKKVKTYGDFREALERKDIDAVIVATPDHWHPIVTVKACEAGKDVYVEKPVSNRIHEGYAMVEAARKHNRVIQVGTQQRSSQLFKNAVSIVQSGILGEVLWVETGLSGEQPIGNPPNSPVPKGLDWDMWLGPAPVYPFNQNRFGYAINQGGSFILNEKGNLVGWGHWRYFWNHGGGKMTDWGVHLLDVVRWAMNEAMPVGATAYGGNALRDYPPGDNRETPDHISAWFMFDKFYCSFIQKTANEGDWGEVKDSRGRGHGIRFYGKNGTLFVNRYYYEIEWLKNHPVQRRTEVVINGTNIPAYAIPAYAEHGQFPNDGEAHFNNFVECVRTRARPVSDIEIGNNSTVMCHLGNVAYRNASTSPAGPWSTVWWNNDKKSVNPSHLNQLLEPQERDRWKLEH